MAHMVEKTFDIRIHYIIDTFPDDTDTHLFYRHMAAAVRAETIHVVRKLWFIYRFQYLL